MTRSLRAVSAFVVVLGISAGAWAQVLYQTSFEPPTYIPGSGVNGIDGWVSGSGGTAANATMTVSSDKAHSGLHSLKSDNTGSVSFYSMRHDLGGWTPASGDPLIASVNVLIDSQSQPNRMYGLYFGSLATSTLGGTVLGMTVDASGNVRAGPVWVDTYTNSGLLGTVNPADALDRWLTITLTYDPLTLEKTAKVSGFGGPIPSVGGSWFTGSPPGNLNLGTDYFALTDRNGVGFFDDLSVVIPEPSAVALVGAAGLAALRRRR